MASYEVRGRSFNNPALPTGTLAQQPLHPLLLPPLSETQIKCVSLLDCTNSSQKTIIEGPVQTQSDDYERKKENK